MKERAELRERGLLQPDPLSGRELQQALDFKFEYAGPCGGPMPAGFGASASSSSSMPMALRPRMNTDEVSDNTTTKYNYAMAREVNQ